MAVVGIPNETWGETVAAVILPKNPDAPPAAETLWSYCRKNLSPQKTPEHWIFVKEYPMTATGKIQKNVLRDLCAEGKLVPVAWTRPDRDVKVA